MYTPLASRARQLQRSAPAAKAGKGYVKSLYSNIFLPLLSYLLNRTVP